MSKKSIIVITGPTASGKTELAIDLAKEHSSEIINADSVQVYKGFDIGSAKPSEAELSEVPHHLFSYLEPEKEFNAGIFLNNAADLIETIQGTPIICGGTGLYIQTLLHGLLKVENEAQGKRKLAELEQEANKDLPSFLYQKLKELDPQTAESLLESNSQRIKRALVYYFSTGRSLAESQNEHAFSKKNYRAYVISLQPERELLYQRINERVLKMLEDGLISEVQELLESHARELRAFSSIGYREVLAYLDKELSYDEMLSSIQQHTRNLAKRQLTWWRNQPVKLGWQKIGSDADFRTQIHDFLNKKGHFAKDQIFFNVVGQEVLT